MVDVADQRTWNVFRRRHAHGLCCAVPADIPIPTFLMTGDWIFGFPFTHGDPPVPGFSPQSAEIGTRYNGFYLFLGFGDRPSTRGQPSFPAQPQIAGEPNDPLAHSSATETRRA